MRFRWLATPSLALAVALLVPACQRSSSSRRPDAPDSVAVARTDSIAVRNLVIDFGARMKQVSLLGPDSARARSLRTQFGDMVGPSLLAEWAREPRRAPGRLTSSPWPERIEITALSRKSRRAFFVDGEVVLRTSADATGDAGRIPVRLILWKAGPRWRIMDYDQGSPRAAGEPASSAEDPSLTPESAAAVVRAFYDAIGARQYAEAYRLWESDGAASGQAMIEFLNTWAQVQSVEANVGPPGPMGAAAGSRYVDVPVRVTTVGKGGERETYSGTYTLRLSVVDGATAKQRTWHIYSASLHKAQTA